MNIILTSLNGDPGVDHLPRKCKAYIRNKPEYFRF